MSALRLIYVCAFVVTGLSLLGLPILSHGASQIDVYHFDDESQRHRYKSLIDEFRCPKCLNTNLSGSDAPIAQDLRRTVHRLVVTEGYTDQEVRDFLQSRYGDFVLYDPPFNARTWIIWIFPLLIVLVGVGVLFSLRRRAAVDEVMSAEDERLLEQILQRQSAQSSSEHRD